MSLTHDIFLFLEGCRQDAAGPAIRRAQAKMRTAGRLVLVEPFSNGSLEKTREEQAQDHEISLIFALDDLVDAGFDITKSVASFCESKDANQMWLIAARKP